MIRLIASDLDGTLLNEEGMLSEKTAECIRNAQQAGILWVAATGRSLKTASELMRTAGVSPEYLLLNGAEKFLMRRLKFKRYLFSQKSRIS